MFLERWWWPIFIPIYALWVFPIFGVVEGGSLSKMAVAGLWLLVGLLISWINHPNVRLNDVIYLPRALLKHPPVLVAVLFGAWTLVSSSFAAYPGISFSGALNGFADGAIWNCTLCLIFVCVYLQTWRDPELKKRLAWAMLAAAVLMTAIGTLEVILQRGVLYANANPLVLPLVGFYGRGHLMGVLALAAGIGIALWFAGASWTLVAVSALSALMGYSFHRAPWLAILPTIPLGWWVTKRLRAALMAGLVIGCSIMFGIWAGTQAKTGVARDLGAENTLATRALLWKAALSGIAERPIPGWGGGQFQYDFYRFWSPEERKTFFRLEFGTVYTGVLGAGMINPIFQMTDPQGKPTTTLITLWKAHNQLLDVGVMWGLPGLVLYAVLVLFSLRGLLRLEPLAVGLLVYQFFLVTWFVILDAEGIFWALMGAATVLTKQAQAVRMDA